MRKKIIFIVVVFVSLIGWVAFMNNYAYSTEYHYFTNCNDVASQSYFPCTLSEDSYGIPFVHSKGWELIDGYYRKEFINQQAYILDILIVVGLPSLIAWIYIFKINNRGRS